MRPILFLALTACTPVDPAADSGPGTGDPYLTGQTGQSGTQPPLCDELGGAGDYAYDEVTPLGFSAEEALAPMLAFGGQLTWEADGTSTALTGAIEVTEDSLATTYDATDGVLRVCVHLALNTDDGAMSAFLVADDLEIRAVGQATLVNETHAMHQLIDILHTGTDPMASLRFELELADATTTGTLSWHPYSDATWSPSASW